MSKFTEERMFELGRLGESVASIATKLNLDPKEFYQALTQSPKLLLAHRKGAQVYHDEYRLSIVPEIKAAFIERVRAGDTKAILWGMDNMVMVNAEHPTSLSDIPLGFAKDPNLKTGLPEVKNEEERRARVESLLSVFMLNAAK